MKAALFAALFALTGLLAGCASAPVQLYTLAPPPSPSPSPALSGVPAAVPAAFAIDVLPVGVPEQLDQPRLVIRQGGGSLVVLEGERWGGPLSDELRAALSLELTRRLATLDLAGLSPPPGRPVLRIKVQLRRFDVWPGDRAYLEADWSLVPDDASGRRAVCHSTLDAAAPAPRPEMVLALQRLVARLAERIADAANRPDHGC
jgi:uncharacterized lipoprotein YmbA